jgi:hypothetical protein
MVRRFALRLAFASAVAIAVPALAQAPASIPLPPQNYGAQPGFFRSAAEMAAFVNPAAAPAPQPVAAPATPAPAPTVAVPVVPVQPVASPIADTRVPDPTQNLQWAERQADRVEAKAQQQGAQLQATPQPVAPGAYNGMTDPANR